MCEMPWERQFWLEPSRRTKQSLNLFSKAPDETAFLRTSWRVREVVGRVSGEKPWGRQFRLKPSGGACLQFLFPVEVAKSVITCNNNYD